MFRYLAETRNCVTTKHFVAERRATCCYFRIERALANLFFCFRPVIVMLLLATIVCIVTSLPASMNLPLVDPGKRKCFFLIKEKNSNFVRAGKIILFSNQKSKYWLTRNSHISFTRTFYLVN